MGAGSLALLGGGSELWGSAFCGRLSGGRALFGAVSLIITLR
jgi:hypothetical protein